MRISETKKALRWRLLSTDMGHRQLVELQKERGILRFPDFSQPSPPWRFHNTTDSEPRRRRRHVPIVLRFRVHPSRPALSPIRLDSDKVSTSTQVSPRCFRPLGTRPKAPPLGLPGQASERRLAQTGEWGQPFGLTLPLPGNIKPRRRCAAFGSSIWQQRVEASVIVETGQVEVCAQRRAASGCSVI